MIELGIIGGSGLKALAGFELLHQKEPSTPFGEASSPLSFGTFAGREVVFLARHGQPHHIPPHKVNYRANLWALRANGVSKVISINAVGGISGGMQPGRIVIPDQIIDYTSSRAHTFFDGDTAKVVHVDFSRPYDEGLRRILVDAVVGDGLDVRDGGTYGATQGPRLETAAEIQRMERDGCHIVGMTGMPEASLARELSLRYASIAVVANWAAGKLDEEISMAVIERNLADGMQLVQRLLMRAVPLL
ncbi:MAG: S-methyl-5'-thioinosine phosphorylase [Gammaproteobacteria bacterium]|nr:S-methyl-5'-thioinosine phosphorylase [Gammaproteobacteria bacterium]